MSKIVQAVNSIIANPNLITRVTEEEGELFFLYKGKYKWSMANREDGRHLWFYPGETTLEYIISQNNNWGLAGIPVVHYFDTEIGTKEAKASFAELYSILSEKVYGMDEVLDDIIASEEEL